MNTAADWIAMVTKSFSREEVVRTMGPPERVMDDLDVGSLRELVSLSYTEPLASFFLKSDRLVLVVLIPDDAQPEFPNSRDRWQKRFGEPDKILPSRRGRHYKINLNAGSGLAAHFDPNGHLQAIELFKPSSTEAYEGTFYSKPPRFTK